MATVEANPNLGAQIVEDAKEYVLYSWSTQDAINPIAVAGAEGRHFWDYEGNRYLDFASQLVNVNIGHQHPKIIAAIKEQADRLCTIGPPMASESRSRLGRLLEEVTPGDLCMSFFTNSGAEANENAIKLARLATGRHKIIARYRSYHGATHGSIMLTGDPRRWPNEPGMGGVVRVPGSWKSRSWGLPIVLLSCAASAPGHMAAHRPAHSPSRFKKSARRRRFKLIMLRRNSLANPCPPLIRSCSHESSAAAPVSAIAAMGRTHPARALEDQPAGGRIVARIVSAPPAC